MFKLLGNSAYGKLIEAVERQTKVIYTKDQGKVDRAKRSVWFDDMEEMTVKRLRSSLEKESLRLTSPLKSEL